MWPKIDTDPGRTAKRSLLYFLFLLFLSGCGGGDGSLPSNLLPGDSPKVSLAVNSAKVEMNESISLSWESENVSSCVASGGWSGNKGISGIELVEVLSGNTTFTITCSGVKGSSSDNVEVTVTEPVQGAPTLNFSASLTSLPYNGSTTLNWSSTNASNCIAAGGWSGNKSGSGSQTINALSSNTSFSLSCIGPAGAVTDQVDIVVSPPIAGPTVNLSASPLNVAQGGSTQLTWTTNSASSCVASGDWTGAKNLSGNNSLSNLVSDQTYTLTCTGVGGTSSDSVTVTVAQPLPTLSFSASPTSLPYNGSTTLTWTSSNTSGCIASGGWTGSKGASGSNTINNLTADTSFSLSCTGSGGTGTDQINVIVSPQVGAPVVNLSANAMNVAYNGSTALTWTTTNADSCVGSGNWSGSKNLSGSSNRSNLISDQTYTLTCTGGGGTGSDSVTITVAAPPPTLSFNASPQSVAQNGSTILSWDSPGATGCVASGDWSGNKAAAGSQTMSGLMIDRQFNLACSGLGGSVNGTVNVTVVLNSIGTALLSWMPPTENIDGSQLVDLAGYRIYYGTSPGGYSDTIDITTPGLSSYLVENLASSAWYFAITAINASGIESAVSQEVTKTIN